MNILIVEDDDLIADSIAMALEDEGHIYTITNTAEDGLNAVREHHYDAVILDINLPDSDGFQFAKSLRRSHINTSVLVVSGRASVTDKVVALRSGADGYLTKPFDRQELIANLTAIIRRAHGHSDNKIVTGPIMVDLNKHEVLVGNKRLNLRQKNIKFLNCSASGKAAPWGNPIFKPSLRRH